MKKLYKAVCGCRGRGVKSDKLPHDVMWIRVGWDWSLPMEQIWGSGVRNRWGYQCECDNVKSVEYSFKEWYSRCVVSKTLKCKKQPYQCSLVDRPCNAHLLLHFRHIFGISELTFVDTDICIWWATQAQPIRRLFTACKNTVNNHFWYKLKKTVTVFWE